MSALTWQSKPKNKTHRENHVPSKPKPSANRPPAIQAKLKIGQPNDIYEQEADRLADRVMRMTEGSLVNGHSSLVQRKSRCPGGCPEEEPIQIKPLAQQIAPLVQRQSLDDEEEKLVQVKSISPQPPIVTPVIESSINSLNSGGQTLSQSTRAFFEPRFGTDFSHVRVHTGAEAAQTAQAINANAFTIGNNIAFNHGQYSPATTNGKQLLAHELTHVVQQGSSKNFKRANRHNGPAEMPTVQLSQKVYTSFGRFQTETFKKVSNNDGQELGVRILLRFYPKENAVDATKIALSQSVRKTDASGNVYSHDDIARNRTVAAGNAGAGYVIDSGSASRNPVYGTRFENEDITNTRLADTEESGSPRHPEDDYDYLSEGSILFELGHCYRVNPASAEKDTKPAGLFDEPVGPNQPGRKKMFETTALAIEGADEGTYYGSVKWEYEIIVGSGGLPEVKKKDIELVSKGNPSANFLEPAILWNNSRTRGTLEVIANPANIYNDSGSSIGTLPRGTRVSQQTVANSGSTKLYQVEILDQNNIGTGNSVFIEAADVRDMEDSRPTIDLPIPVSYQVNQKIKDIRKNGGERELEVIPSISGWTVKNEGVLSADNKCELCGTYSKLGVDCDDATKGVFSNGIELKATIANHTPGYSYDIKRRIVKFLELVIDQNGAAEDLGNIPDTLDDSSDADEHLTPIPENSNHHIYSMDFPAITKVPKGKKYTNMFQAVDFFEYVDITCPNKAKLSDKNIQEWHSVVWITKLGETWSVNKKYSEIGKGYFTSKENSNEKEKNRQ